MKKSYLRNVVNESYIKPKKKSAEFDYQTFVFYDRSMQPGGGPGMADWIDSPEDLEDALAAATKVQAPHGVDMWEDVDGNIIFKAS